MSATEWQRGGNGWILWVVGLAILAWVASIGAQMEASPQLAVSPHAVEKHGAAALRGAEYLRRGGDVHKDPCREEGKEMWTWRDGRKWYVAIVNPDGIIATIYTTTQGYLQSAKQRDGCGDGLQLGPHDWASGGDMPSAAAN